MDKIQWSLHNFFCNYPFFTHFTGVYVGVGFMAVLFFVAVLITVHFGRKKGFCCKKFEVGRSISAMYFCGVSFLIISCLKKIEGFSVFVWLPFCTLSDV